jgi:hypothetical protein
MAGGGLGGGVLLDMRNIGNVNTCLLADSRLTSDIQEVQAGIDDQSFYLYYVSQRNGMSHLEIAPRYSFSVV